MTDLQSGHRTDEAAGMGSGSNTVSESGNADRMLLAFVERGLMCDAKVAPEESGGVIAGTGFATRYLRCVDPHAATYVLPSHAYLDVSGENRAAAGSGTV